MSSLISVHYYIYGFRCKTFCHKDDVFLKIWRFSCKVAFLIIHTYSRTPTITFSLKCNRHHSVAALFCRIVVFTVVQRAPDFIGCKFDAKRAFFSKASFLCACLCVALNTCARQSSQNTVISDCKLDGYCLLCFFSFLSRISSLKWFDHS